MKKYASLAGKEDEILPAVVVLPDPCPCCITGNVRECTFCGGSGWWPVGKKECLALEVPMCGDTMPPTTTFYTY